ncbi:WSC domain-containing protein [Xylariaceae sp. FL1651]|nr:WSC domain-containing protein [Xylariaceae sp. FL1651]
MLLKCLARAALPLQLLLLLCLTVSGQQFMGDSYNNSLDTVPGAEIAFWKITDKKGRTFTQLNYFSQAGNGQRLNPAKVKRAVIVIHGLQRDPGTYMSNMLSALSQVPQGTGPDFTNTQIIAPYFPNGDDKGVGYPWNASAPAGGYGSTSRALVWKGSGWMDGDNNQYPRLEIATSAFDCVDQMITYFANKTMYPNMKQIVVGGHSAGAQYVHRYAAVGKDLSSVLGNIGLTYWIGNPNSYVWLNSSRPVDPGSCSIFDDWRYGLQNYTPSYNTDLIKKGAAAVQANYQSKAIAYARALQDRGDTSSDCGPESTGATRDERFFNFIQWFPPTCSSSAVCDTVDYVDTGHDASVMFASAAGQARLFIDNFNGDGSVATDFYCPRQAAGDNPHPDSSCTQIANQPPTGSYNGMTYQGCWSDQDPRTFSVQLPDDPNMTISSCTAQCAQKGYKLAGMEYSVQCFCGNQLTSKAIPITERSCWEPCGGNSSQVCGGDQRLSVWGTQKPTVISPPKAPATIGNYQYAGCYYDNNPSKALTTAKPGGSSMTLESCAASCAGFTYWGAEYGGECYCGNSLTTGNTKVADSDCQMTCNGNQTEYCGAGNRLTLYSLNGTAVVYGDGGSPGGSGTATSTQSSTGTATTSTQSSTSTALTCPTSDGATYVSSGKTFSIKCGIDHAGGDLKSLTTDTFSGCIDACTATTGCVVVAYSGSACYLKSSVGAEVNDGVWGAVLVTANSGTSTGSLSSTTPTITSSVVTSATTSQPSTTPSSTPLACPSSDGSTYVSSGKTFSIKCGIDHAGGDLKSLTTDTFSGCIDACTATTGCVVVAYSGSACYLKSSVGAEVNDGVWGAVLVTSSAGTSTGSLSSTTPTVTSSAVTSSVVTSATTTPSSAPLACPASDGKSYVSSGKTYTVQCGIDHAGGDLTSLTTDTFSGCIDACTATKGCVVVAYSGSACYLKSSVGAPVSDGVWGAILVTSEPSAGSTTKGLSGASSTVTSSVVTTSSAITSPATSRSSTTSTSATTSSTTKSSSTITSSTTTSRPLTTSTSTVMSSTTTSRLSTLSTSTITSFTTTTKSSTTSCGATSTSCATPSPSAVTCPKNNGTIYTATSGTNFTVECGFERAGGDMAAPNPVWISGLAACFEACGARDGCVAVAMSGNACYLKKSVGTKVFDGVNGGTLH